MNAKNALSKLNEILAEKVENHLHESTLLLAFAIESSLEKIYSYPEMEISDSNFQQALKFARQRVAGKPVAYIVGKKEFYGLEFVVNKHALIPRPETEMIVDETLGLLENFPRNKKLLVIDVGTGTGCIPISLAKNIKRKNIEFIATDISEKALKIANKNAERHGVDNKIRFFKSDLLDFFDKSDCSMPAPFDEHSSFTGFHVPCSMIITANLPYLSKDIYNNSPVSVKKFEPKGALLSEEDGLNHYRRLFDEIYKSFVILSEANEERESVVRPRVAEALAVAQESFLDEHSLPADPSTSLGMTKLNSLSIIIEISPEQKVLVEKMIKKKFGDKASTSFKKDLAGKWRLARIEL